jgi:glycosyltransferase involved in cell wall biosynthesis
MNAYLLSPRMSVVIPAYNEQALLPACLRSLAAQDYQGRYEVIVVDNNSTDATAAIACELGATVVFEPHAGVCWARQRGTEQARGEIVISTDADTTFDSGWLSRIDAEFQADPSMVAVTGPCRFTAAPLWGRAYAWLLFAAVYLIYRLTGRVIYVTATNFAFRRSAWRGFDTNATQGGDEIGLLRQLRPHGNLGFLHDNPTYTSARRMRRGLLYNLLVTCLYYYLTGYVLNRITGRTVIGTYPHIRGLDHPPRRTQRARLAVAASFAGVLAAATLIACRVVW